MSTEHNPFAALLAPLRIGVDDAGFMVPFNDGPYLEYADVLAALAAAVPADLAEAGKVLEGVTGTSWVYRPGHYDDWGIVKDGDCVICQARHPDRISSEVLSEWRAKGQDPWEANARFIAWCREGVPALLARIAAQEAQIKGLAADRDNLSAKLEIERLLTDGIHRRAEAAETALAAMTKERDEHHQNWQRAFDANVRWLEKCEAQQEALAASEARVAKLVEAGKRVLEPLGEPCRQDHHGYCQAHFIEADCSVAALRAAITEAGQ